MRGLTDPLAESVAHDDAAAEIDGNAEEDTVGVSLAAPEGD